MAGFLRYGEFTIKTNSLDYVNIYDDKSAQDMELSHHNIGLFQDGPFLSRDRNQYMRMQCWLYSVSSLYVYVLQNKRTKAYITYAGSRFFIYW